MRRLVIFAVVTLSTAGPGQAQRLTSGALGVGAGVGDVTHATAVFSITAGVHYRLPWLVTLQRSVADLKNQTGSRRDVSIALMPTVAVWNGRLFAAAGAALNSRDVQVIGAADVSKTRIGLVAVAGLRVPMAGDALMIELSGRADQQDVRSYAGLLGVRISAGTKSTLTLGEPQRVIEVAEKRAVWNDVLMQLILLHGNLESFTRIREIEAGIELEFEQAQVTLWEDISKVGRVLAAADPPVVITALGPNAGRVAAAVTAGTFPAERIRLQRADRVYLRVEQSR